MPLKYDTREVTHGTSRGFWADITRDTSTGAVNIGTPQAFTGLNDVKIETKQDQSSYYADNVTHITLNGNPQTTGDLTVYQFPKAFVTGHLGKKAMENGGLTDTGNYKSFVFGYVETVTNEFGDETELLHEFFNMQASAPTGESKSDEDKATPVEFDIPVTASQNNGVLDSDGKPVTELQLLKTNDNANFFESAFDKVILPTDTPSTGQ